MDVGQVAGRTSTTALRDSVESMTKVLSGADDNTVNLYAEYFANVFT